MTTQEPITITLPTDHTSFWVVVALVCLAGLSGLVFFGLRRQARDGALEAGWEMRAIYGFAAIIAPIWIVLLGVVLFALWRLVWSFPNPNEASGGTSLFWGMVETRGSGGPSDVRWHVLALVGLMTALGGLVATPLTLMRLSLTQKQTDTATDSLFNEKINAASEDLHAMRQRSVVKEDGSFGETIWEADVTRRNTAIDRLEGLVKERPEEATRVARLLSVYVRELSRQYPAKLPPEDLAPEGLKTWAEKLEPARSDFQTAVTSLGRLRALDPRVDLERNAIDLRQANLQSLDLTGLRLSGAMLRGAQLQGAVLRWTKLQGAELIEAELQEADLRWAELHGAHLGQAELQGADLREAKLQGTSLFMAKLQGAYLCGAELQGAVFRWAKLQGADLSEAAFDEITDFSGAFFRGALFYKSDLSSVRINQAQVDETFGDASVSLPREITRPAHWPREELADYEVHRFRRGWWRFIGFDPEDPSTWKDPKDR